MARPNLPSYRSFSQTINPSFLPSVSRTQYFKAYEDNINDRVQIYDSEDGKFSFQQGKPRNDISKFWSNNLINNRTVNRAGMLGANPHSARMDKQLAGIEPSDIYDIDTDKSILNPTYGWEDSTGWQIASDFLPPFAFARIISGYELYH